MEISKNSKVIAFNPERIQREKSNRTTPDVSTEGHKIFDLRTYEEERIARVFADIETIAKETGSEPLDVAWGRISVDDRAREYIKRAHSSFTQE